MTTMLVPTGLATSAPLQLSAALNITRASQYKLLVAVNDTLAACSEGDTPRVFTVVADTADSSASRVLPGGVHLKRDLTQRSKHPIAET
jgi:hypothetical protein